MEIEENPDPNPEQPDAIQSSQNGNADTSSHMEGGAEPIKLASKRSWRRSLTGSDKKKEKPEKNKVELLSIKVRTKEYIYHVD